MLVCNYFLTPKGELGVYHKSIISPIEVIFNKKTFLGYFLEDCTI